MSLSYFKISLFYKKFITIDINIYKYKFNLIVKIENVNFVNQAIWTKMNDVLRDKHEDVTKVVLNEAPKIETLLNRSLTRYLLKLGLISHGASAFGVVLENGDDENGYMLQKSKGVFVLRPLKINEIVTPIFTKYNYILLETADGSLNNFKLSSSHLIGIKKYLDILSRYFETHLEEISQSHFYVSECLSDMLFEELGNGDVDASCNFVDFKSSLRDLLHVTINAKQASTLSDYRETQWNKLHDGFISFLGHFNALSLEKKLFASFLIECLLNSSHFNKAPLDNKIAFISLLSQTQNPFLSCCSIQSIAKSLLLKLQEEDIAGYINDEGTIPGITIAKSVNFKRQLLLVIHKFEHDESKHVLFKIIPVYDIAGSEGTIKEFSQINKAVDSNVLKDELFRTVSWLTD